jgi:hypothetical protein
MVVADLVEQQVFQLEADPRSIAVADFDEDGNQDIATANAGAIHFLIRFRKWYQVDFPEVATCICWI